MTWNILVAIQRARLGSILLAAFSIAAFWASLPSAMAQIGVTQATLSCNDGHNVIFDVDQTALTSLLADVQAINISGTGLSCTLTTTTIDPSTETTKCSFSLILKPRVSGFESSLRSYPINPLLLAKVGSMKSRIVTFQPS